MNLSHKWTAREIIGKHYNFSTEKSAATEIRASPRVPQLELSAFSNKNFPMTLDRYSSKRTRRRTLGVHSVKTLANAANKTWSTRCIAEPFTTAQTLPFKKKISKRDSSMRNHTTSEFELYYADYSTNTPDHWRSIIVYLVSPSYFSSSIHRHSISKWVDFEYTLLRMF